MGKSIRERFYEKVQAASENECWEWIASCGKSGYGHMICRGKHVDAHRISYILHRGPIPEGMLVMHLCDNKRCVNPKHLVIGTQFDNMRHYAATHDIEKPPGLTFKGRHHTAESKRKLSAAAMGNTRCKGRPVSKNLGHDKFGRFISLPQGGQSVREHSDGKVEEATDGY